ncbi:MAG: hypothetical protein JWL83_3595 [Actinomycetia bacterium]|nr:hypothetical protein [Actinomycetes bacterium]
MLRRPVFFLAASVVATVALAAGCGSSANKAVSTSTTAPAAQTQTVNAKTPSVSSKMICATEGQQEIAGSLGVKPSKPLAPKWLHKVYSCDYVYPTGVMKLSVRELPSDAAAKQAFDRLGTEVGRLPAGTLLGQGTYKTRNGSMVVLKDSKVLLVDVSGLPAHFGKPPLSRNEVALTVAVTVMGCWTGA